MIRIILLIVYITISLIGFGQNKHSKLTGTYFAINNGFERSSKLILFDNGLFNYKYELGGCQGDISGTWLVMNNYLSLMNHEEFMNKNTNEKEIFQVNDTLQIELPRPKYPDLSKIKWRIGKNWIKPKNKIDTGCFIVSEKHKRK